MGEATAARRSHASAFTADAGHNGSEAAATLAGARPAARGKFLFVGDEKLYVAGVTYGTFAPHEDGHDYPGAETVERDFAAMAENGINTVRVYTAPPRWLLDAASRHGLFVIVGIPWEQHVAFLEDKRRARSIEERVRSAVRACAAHPAVLCYSIGNEIPASIVRWHGRRPVERFLESLYRAVKEEDPDALVTYVNYPSTEYLDLPFVDLVCFNVFLEDEERLEAYLARLQNLAGERPLLITELGLDSRRNGAEAQAVSLDWQVRTAFRAGCAGAIVFSWTDEWHRGGHEVDDWEFGLVTRERAAKPALAAVRRAFAEVPFPATVDWPQASVVVCSHNGAATIRDCVAAATRLDYPDYEVIVVDDGSTDATADIAAAFGVRLIRTANRGLSNARNTGIAAATGRVVAFIDDDAWPDPDWLRYLVAELLKTPHAGVGGPNVAPPAHGLVAEAVARAPGGPVHVLLSDREAEHVPGVNMAFWKDRLLDVGGFDARFRVAGDDVDVCWRVHERGWTIGFSPAALVWHRPRASTRAFLRQQRGYGRAEALLEQKWPEKYNRGGHLRWRGRVYGGPLPATLRRRWRVYYGTWGSGLFQSIYQRSPGVLSSLPLMPEWYLLIALLAGTTTYGLAREPLAVGLPGLGIPVELGALVGAVGVLLVNAWLAAARVARGVRLRALTALLFLLQPLARLGGRVAAGLTPWRLRGTERHAVPWPGTRTVWSESWELGNETLSRLELELKSSGAAVARGGDFDRWDLEVRPGILSRGRLRLAVEEHGEGNRLLRFRIWPRISLAAVVLFAALVAFSALAAARGSTGGAVPLAVAAAIVGVRVAREASIAVALLAGAVEGEATRFASDGGELDEILMSAAHASARPRALPVSDELA